MSGTDVPSSSGARQGSAACSRTRTTPVAVDSGDPDVDLTWLDLLSRQTATPDVAVEMDRVWYETDVRELLPAIQAPSLLIQHEGRAHGWRGDGAHRVTDAGCHGVLVPGSMLGSGMEHVVETVRDASSGRRAASGT